MAPAVSSHPVVGVGVVVWQGGKVLLIRRGKPPRQGQWSLPGGHQELGETVREAAVREVREEAGIDIVLGGLLDVIDAIGRTTDGALSHHYTLVDFDADWASGEAVAGSDAADVAWVEPDRVADYVSWSETERIVGLSAERRRNGEDDGPR